jgi:hypothetical protein
MVARASRLCSSPSIPLSWYIISMRKIEIGDIVRCAGTMRLPLPDGTVYTIKRGNIGQVVNKRKNFMPGRNDFLYDVEFFEVPGASQSLKQVKQRTMTCTDYQDDPHSGFSIRKCSNRCTACKDMSFCLVSRH